MILEDLNWELLNNVGISAIAGTRVFYKNPVTQPSDSYVVYSRKDKKRDMVSENNIFQIACFSKDMKQLEDLADAVIACFEDKREMGSTDNIYYSIFLITQTDSDVKLQNGFFYSILSYGIRRTT